MAKNNVVSGSSRSGNPMLRELRDERVKRQYHTYKTAEIILPCHKVVCLFRT